MGVLGLARAVSGGFWRFTEAGSCPILTGLWGGVIDFHWMIFVCTVTSVTMEEEKPFFFSSVHWNGVISGTLIFHLLKKKGVQCAILIWRNFPYGFLTNALCCILGLKGNVLNRNVKLLTACLYSTLAIQDVN